jgi:anti-anti-sigma factor
MQVKHDENGIHVEIADQGNIFNPLQERTTSLAGDQDNGFGWYIIHEIADQVAFAPKQSKEGWNHLHLFKKYIQEGKQMHLAHSTQENVLIITPEGNSLDANDAADFKDKVSHLITTTDRQQVIFDLSHVQFVDSSGLGVFLSILRLLHKSGGELKLVHLNKSVRTMFELVSMHKIFEIYNTTDEAVRSFNI